MRICIISPLAPPYGGVALQAQRLIDGLRQEGVSVTVIKTNVDFPRRFEFVHKIKGVRTLVNFVLYLKALITGLRQVDCVHHMAVSHIYFFLITAPTVILSKLYHKRMIINYRSGEAERFFDRWGGFARIIFRISDEIVVPSQFLKQVFRKLGLESKVIPNIVDLEKFSFVERKKFRPRLINTRHLEPLYNIECTLKAFKIIQEKYGDAELALVGAGSEKAKLEKFARDNELRNVIFYGHISHHRLPDLYRRYDIFVNSSNADNFPGSLVEAAASGLPIVSTKAGGIPYLIEDGTMGLLVDLNDWQGLADRVCFLIENQATATKLAKNAFLQCQNYTWDKVYAQLSDLYKPRETFQSYPSSLKTL